MLLGDGRRTARSHRRDPGLSKGRDGPLAVGTCGAAPRSVSNEAPASNGLRGGGGTQVRRTSPRPPRRCGRQAPSCSARRRSFSPVRAARPARTGVRSALRKSFNLLCESPFPTNPSGWWCTRSPANGFPAGPHFLIRSGKRQTPPDCKQAAMLVPVFSNRVSHLPIDSLRHGTGNCFPLSAMNHRCCANVVS